MVGIRRQHTSSGDSGYINAHGRVMSIESWVAGKDPFRVAANGLPMPMPLRTRRRNPQLAEVYDSSIKPQLPDLLSCHGISYTREDLDYIFTAGEISEGRHTLIVVSNDIDRKQWKMAAKELSMLFVKAGANTIVDTVEVEIWNGRRMYNDTSEVLPNDPTLLAALQQARGHILPIVGEHLNGICSSVAYHTRCPRLTPGCAADVVKKPTIIISCHPGSTCDFEAVEKKVIEVLDMSPLQIYLELLPGYIPTPVTGSIEPVMINDITQKPLNGSSIGIQGNNGRAGTLGGWCFLNLPQGRKQVPCAMTCYHVIKPDDEDTSNFTDTAGIRWTDGRGCVTVEYPSACDVPINRRRLDAQCAHTSQDSGLQREQEILLSLTANPGIGKVILASGYQLKNNHRLDWALIESPDTFSPNKPPPSSHFRGPIALPSTTPAYRQTLDSRIRKFGRVKPGDWVTKVGRTTDLTSGEINGMERDVEWMSGARSQEIEIISHTQDFAGRGDSGSFVINTAGELVGMLSGADQRAGFFGIGFMTPIALIQESVREMTGGGFLSLE